MGVMDRDKQDGAVQSFRVCVAHFCLLLGDHLETVSPVLHTFLAHHKQSRQPLSSPAEFLASVHPSSVKDLYRAWCRVAVECVRSRQVGCINSLVEWLNKLHQSGFPTGLSSTVEGIGIYVLLRSIHQANHFDNSGRELIIEVLGKMPLYPILPFMHTTIDYEEYCDIVACALGIDDTESLLSVVDSDEDDEEPLSPLSNFAKRKDTDPFGIGDDKIKEATLTDAARFETTFAYIHGEEYASHGPFDRGLLEYSFKLTFTRTESYLSLLSYLEYLEEHSDEISSFTSRYVSCIERLTEMVKRYVPSPTLASAVYEAVRRQFYLCQETMYSYKVTRSTEELMEAVVSMLRWQVTKMHKSEFTSSRATGPAQTSVDRDFDATAYSAAPPGTLVVQRDHIWLQVASRLERSSIKQPSEVASLRTGVFRLYNDKLLWFLLAEDEDDLELAEEQVDKQTDSASALERIRVQCKMPRSMYNPFGAETSGERESTVSDFYIALAKMQPLGDQDILKTTSVTQHPLSPDSRLPDMCLKDSIVEIPFDFVEKFTFAPIDKNRFNISIYSDRVFHLFPFTQVEVERLARAISEFSGLAAFERDENVASMLRDKLEEIRLKILVEELYPRQAESPWITSTNELAKCLNSLTNEKHPLKLVTLEWLYHSCHANHAVMKETVTVLKYTWKQKPSEKGRIRVLAILERILEGGDLHADCETLQSILDWLESIENQLDPHKFPQTLHVILKLSKLAQILKSRTVAPIPFTADTAVFNLEEENRFFLELFRAGSER